MQRQVEEAAEHLRSLHHSIDDCEEMGPLGARARGATRRGPRVTPQRGGERAAGADLVVEDDGLAVDAKRLPRLAPGEDLVDAGRRGRRRSGVGETVLGGFGVPTGAEVGERLPVRWSVLGAVGETLQMRDVEGHRQ